MAALVAVAAGGGDVRPVAPSILLSDQMLSGRLQACRLTQGQPVRDREAAVIDKPHGQVAVVTKATLTMEGSITGGSVALGHGGVQMSEGNSRRLVSEDAQVPEAYGLCRHNTVG